MSASKPVLSTLWNRASSSLSSSVSSSSMLRSRVWTSSTSLSSSSAVSSLLQSRRRISTLASPTVTDKSGNVRDPGHIQWATSESEQQKYGLSKYYGHSPVPVRSTSSSTVQATFPTGESFNLVSLEKPAKTYSEDKPVVESKSTIRIDHGEMTPDQARKLKAAITPELYETSGKKRANCVHVHAQVAKAVFDHDVGDVHVHERPQDLAEKMRTLKTTP